MKSNFLLPGIVFLTLFCLSSGCGPRSAFPTEPIDGMITYDGKPLDHASIAFSPVSNETPGAKPAFALSDAAGKFKVTAANGGLEGKGTAIGKYVISVTKEIGTTPLSDEEIKERNAQGIPVQLTFKSVIPQKYTDSATSGLSYEVVRGKNTCVLELKSE